MAVLLHDEAGVRRLTLHRPDKRNALTQAMYTALAEALREAATNPAIRVVLLTGSAECFTAGNDIADFRGAFDAATSPVVDFLRTLVTFPKPVVAAVAGAAVGIGTTMLLHCDLAYAQDNARFALPFVNLGLCPEGASSLLLPQRAGALLANELLLLGEAFDAATALRAGIINAVVPDALATAAQKAAAVAAKPPAALAATKALLRQGADPRLAAQMDAEFTRFAALLTGPEAAEATSAFMEKRKPDFSRFSA